MITAKKSNKIPCYSLTISTAVYFPTRIQKNSASATDNTFIVKFKNENCAIISLC